MTLANLSRNCDGTINALHSLTGLFNVYYKHLGCFFYCQNSLSLLKFTYAHKFIEKEMIVRFLVTMKVVLLQKESTHCYK